MSQTKYSVLVLCNSEYVSYPQHQSVVISSRSAVDSELLSIKGNGFIVIFFDVSKTKAI